VPVRGLDAIRRANPDMSRWGEVFGPNDPPGAFGMISDSVLPR